MSRLVTVLLMICALFNAIKTSSADDQYKNLTSEEFYQGMQDGSWDIVVDVRTREEWDEGHIENATFLESLQLYGTDGQISSPDDIIGCRGCVVVIYCRSGNRAVGASRILLEAGFSAPIYNGLGVRQWTAAGYDLVTTPASTDAPCMSSPEGTCDINMTTTSVTATPTVSPTQADTSGGVGLASIGWLLAIFIAAMTF